MLEKLAVVTEHDGGPCPKCGTLPKRVDGTWRCLKCGVEPFVEEGDEQEREEEK